MYDINICNVLSNEAYREMIAEEGVKGVAKASLNKIIQWIKEVFRYTFLTGNLIETYEHLERKNIEKAKKVREKLQSIPENLRSEFSIKKSSEKFNFNNLASAYRIAKAFTNERGAVAVLGPLERLHRGIKTEGKLTDDKVEEAYKVFQETKLSSELGGSITFSVGTCDTYDEVINNIKKFLGSFKHRLKKPYGDYDTMMKLSKEEKFHADLSSESIRKVQEIYKIMRENYRKTKIAIKNMQKYFNHFFNIVIKECDRVLNIKGIENLDYIIDDFLIDSIEYIGFESLTEEGFEGIKEIFTKMFKRKETPKKEPLSKEQQAKLDSIVKSSEMEKFIKDGLDSIKKKYPEFFKINNDALVYYKDENGVPNISYDAWKIKDIKTGKDNIARSMMQDDQYEETAEIWMKVQNEALQLFRDAVDKYLSEFKGYIQGDYLGDWDDGDIGFNGIESAEEIIEFNEVGFEGIKDTIVDGIKDSAGVIAKAGKHAKNYIKDVYGSRKEKQRIQKMIESILVTDSIIAELTKKGYISVRVENKDENGKYPIKLRVSDIDKVKKYLNENSVSVDEYKDKVEHYNRTLAKSIMPRIQKLTEKENISLESIGTESEKLEFLLNRDMELEGLIMSRFNKEVEALESLINNKNASLEDSLKDILVQSLESFESDAFKLDPSFELTEEGFECYRIEIKDKEKFQTIVEDKSINTVMESVARNLDSLVDQLPTQEGKEWQLTFTKGGIEDLSIRLKLVD